MFTLDKIKAIDNLLGNPSQKFDCIHIAGTNGKGSVALKIAKGLESEGKKVGLYTSPHIHTALERIQINSTPITQADFDKYQEKILKLDPSLSFFEILTAIAFDYFADQNIEIGVIETGLGGRLDATNIVSPSLVIITSIGKDHTDYLGDNISDIAREKAGISKPNIPIILGPEAQTATPFCQGPIYPVTTNSPLFDEENSAIAKQAMQLLKLNPKAIEKGLKAVQPCRFQEIFGDDYHCILDGAHNPVALDKLYQKLKHHYPDKPFEVFVCLAFDKDIEEMGETLQKWDVPIHLLAIKHERLIDPKILQKKWQKISNVHLSKEITIKREKISLFTGSFYMMADILQKLCL